MAKYDGVLSKEDLTLYNYEKTKNILDSYFLKYRNYKQKMDVILKKTKGCLDQLENMGVFTNTVSNPTFNKVKQLDNIRKYVDLTDQIIKLSIEELNSEEKLIFKKCIILGCTDEELMEILNRAKAYITERKKSCYIKVARWFDLEVYNDFV